jgi:LysR family transcriptional activator of glutamate synthase operon
VHSHDAPSASLVSDGQADLEFTARRPLDPEVRWARLVNQQLCLAVPSDHRLADRAQVGLHEVAVEDFVMLKPAWDLRSLAEELCAAAGFSPRVVFEQDDMQLVRGFVAAGLGVAIVPAPGDDIPPSAAGAEQLIRLTDAGAFREVGLTWATDRRLLPSAELFRSHAMAVTPLGNR